MLSKYYHIQEAADNSKGVNERALALALLEALKSKYKQVAVEAIHPGGTLGVFFELSLDGKRKFAKTHQLGQTYRENLKKEFQFLSSIYRDVLEIEQYDITQAGQEFTFLIMDFLSMPQTEMGVLEIRECIHRYQKALQKEKKEIKLSYTFDDVVNAGAESLEILHQAALISESLYERCKDSIAHIQRVKADIPVCPCHGDLSNVNIMINDKGEMLVVDWEDAILAFAEYDFLYWLTFFSQRKLYSIELFRKFKIDLTWGIDVMVLITLVKSEMSYQNESYKKNSLTFEERILEMYQILGGQSEKAD